MTNLINSQSMNNNNAIAARNISSENTQTKRNIPAVTAPDYLPKFSIDKALQEKDEFRKNVLYSNYQTAEKSKKRKNNLCKLAVMLAAAAGYIILKKKT